jgi:hypothetical protein
MRVPSTRTLWSGLGALAVAILLAGCGDSGGPGDGSECTGADDLETCLPSWQDFSPLEAEQAPTPEGTATTDEVTETLQRYDSTGAQISLGNVTFVCTDQKYNFLDNPDRAISFNLDETVLWPGALIQGKSHRDGAAASGLLELPVRERAPLSLSVTFNNQDNTRTVDAPDYGSVNSAKGSMIGNAQAEGLATSNNIEFDAKTYSSEKQAALEFGLSGRYLGFEAKASGSVTRSVTTNVVAAKFIQQMYVVGVTQPATPAEFFNDAFTAERYQSQASLGRIGPDNPPLYVSRIGYGRMMVFAMSSKAEASEIAGSLRAAWNGIGAGGSATLDAKQSAILAESEIRITQVGGDQGNALAAIKSGNLADYFTNTAPLTSAAPLWFELKALTGEVAKVSEPGEYTVTTCTPKLPGTFDYQAEQTLTIPFTAGTQRQTVQADVNNDNRMDIVFNERRSAPALNRVHVALAAGAGVFTLASPADNPNTPTEGWETYEMVVADIDGDGRDDLAWNHRATNNVVYAGMTNGDGSFTWRNRQQHTNTGWGSSYNVTTGDLNGDGRTDLLWSNAGSSTVTLRHYFGLAKADSSFMMSSNYFDFSANFSGYGPPLVGNFDGNPYGDIVLNALASTYNNTYVARFTPTSDTTGTLALATPLGYTIDGWGAYVWRIGDIDGQRATDLLWASPSGAVHRALNDGDASFTAQTYQSAAVNGASNPFVADFNNDGTADLLLNRRTDTVNEVLVGFGTSTGAFTFPAGIQTHTSTPTVGWVPFGQVFVGDVNADGKADIVWTNPSSDARVFVALAK